MANPRGRATPHALTAITAAYTAMVSVRAWEKWKIFVVAKIRPQLTASSA